MSTVIPGRCRHCGCTGDGAHLIYAGGELEPCAWTDSRRIVCTSPGCIKAEQARIAAAKALDARPSKYRGWGYGAIVADKRREDRLRRRKGRAA